MIELGCYLYEGKGEPDSVYIYAVANWEAPYHRTHKDFEVVAESSGTFEFNNEDELRSLLNRQIKIVLKELKKS